jgi:hypothetical protein
VISPLAFDPAGWVSRGGWLVDIIEPSTDRLVITQAIVVAMVFAAVARAAWRRRLLGLWAGTAMFTAGLFVLRASH